MASSAIDGGDAQGSDGGETLIDRDGRGRRLGHQLCETGYSRSRRYCHSCSGLSAVDGDEHVAIGEAGSDAATVVINFPIAGANGRIRYGALDARGAGCGRNHDTGVGGSIRGLIRKDGHEARGSAARLGSTTI